MGLTRPRAYQIYDIDYKQSVRALSTSNVTLTGGAPSQVDGINLSANDRILVIGQSNAVQNGIYYVTALGTGSNGTWSRTTDANQTGEMEAGMIIMVTEGAVYADTSWKLITNDPIVLGTSELVFELNTGVAFGNIVANGTPVTSNSASGTFTLAAGNNVSITGNNTSKTITISASGGGGGSGTAIVNGTSNVDIASANANVTVSVAGTSNVAVFSTSGLAVTGNITGNGISTTTVSNTAPVNPEQGDIWIVGNTGVQLIYFTSGGNSQWAEMEAATSIVVGDYGNANVLSYLTTGVAGNIIPATNITYDLGNSTNRWNDIWLANSTIYLGSAQISSDGSAIVLPANTVVGGNPIVVETGGSSEFTANVSAGNLISQGIVSATGNITGNYIIGNGSQLTGLPASYSNANVVSLLSAFGSNSISTTGTVTSGAQNITGNVNVTGNIIVTGNLNYSNVTDLVVGDPLIYIGANNSGNVYDLGMVVSYNDGTYQHGGWVRDATDGTWKLFGNVVAEPTTTIDFANAIYQPMRSGAITSTAATFTGNVSAGNVSVSGSVKFGDDTTQTTAGASAARSVALNMILG